MSKGGFCLAYREAWTHPAFNNLREAAIWNFLYQNAFWEDGERNFNGHTFLLKRGQIVVSIGFLAKGFGMTDKGVRVVIQKLEKLGMLGKQGASKGTVITICNYDKFQQSIKTEGEHLGKRGANEGRAEGDNNKQTNKQTTKISKEGVSTKPPSPPPKNNRGTRLKEDWDIPQEWGEWAVSEFNWDVAKVIKTGEKFKDHWLSVVGTKGVKLDWFATWRNWCRRTNEGF